MPEPLLKIIFINCGMAAAPKSIRQNVLAAVLLLKQHSVCFLPFLFALQRRLSQSIILIFGATVIANSTFV